MPLVRIDGVVIDFVRRAEGQAAVCAAHKHHVGCASARWHHASQHVNVVVSGGAGTIDGQEYHSIQTRWIDSPATDEATHVDGGASVKGWRLAADLGIARANAVKAAPFSTDKKIAVGVHIERSVHRPVGNNDRILPGDPAIGGALEFHAAAAAVNAVV